MAGFINPTTFGKPLNQAVICTESSMGDDSYAVHLLEQ